MAITEKHLAQTRENSTSAVSLYSPASGTRTVIKNITVCNQSAGASAFSLFLDNDGTTYDESTALYFDRSLASNETLSIDTYLVMDNAAGNLAYQSDTANALTITVSGAEIT